MARKRLRSALAPLLLALWAPPTRAQTHRATRSGSRGRQDRSSLTGVLDEEMWKTAERVERWFEFNPGTTSSRLSHASAISHSTIVSA
jgi:hypothetical protein